MFEDIIQKNFSKLKEHCRLKRVHSTLGKFEIGQLTRLQEKKKEFFKHPSRTSRALQGKTDERGFILPNVATFNARR